MMNTIHINKTLQKSDDDAEVDQEQIIEQYLASVPGP